jgi:hypothetical protein
MHARGFRDLQSDATHDRVFITIRQSEHSVVDVAGPHLMMAYADVMDIAA